MKRFVALALAAAGSMLAAAASAEEGMWTFDDVPMARVERTVGVRLGRAWLDHLRGASVRLTSGCSAAVVSREGLAVTNLHCLLACAQSLSAPGRDYVADGFLTDARAEERACPGLQAEVLVGITDATAQIFAASYGKFADAYVAAREGAIARAEREACGRDRRLRCQVISFFGGGRFKVYRYRRYDDVRLVFAPEFAAAFFGGDPDNFTFPRLDLDCAFVRLYDNGRPAATREVLAWSTAPPLAGEAVFVSGNPGVTERGATVAELQNDRDLVLPVGEAEHEALRQRLVAFAATGPENRRLVADRLFEQENLLKVIRGRLAILRDPAFMAARAAEEADLRARVAADPRLAAEIADPWTEIAAAQKARAARFDAWRELEGGAGGGSQLFAWARVLVRAAQERARPTALRLPEYADSRLALVEKTVLDDRPVSAALERQSLAFWLQSAGAALGPDSPAMATVLAKEDPAALAQRLAASRLDDPAVRRALWSGGLAAVLASDDPMIVFAQRLDPLARVAREAWEDEVEGPVERGRERIDRARFALEGAELYPDANFSLRLSWGAVAGVGQGAAAIGPFTTLGGLFAKAGDADPFRLAPRWTAARPALDPATVFDFATTNDITGGNSGSPVVNARGELVGVAFDGNAASIAGDFVYDGAQNRTVAVSTVAIGEALAKVYGRAALVAELTAR